MSKHNTNSPIPASKPLLISGPQASGPIASTFRVGESEAQAAKVTDIPPTTVTDSPGTAIEGDFGIQAEEAVVPTDPQAAQAEATTGEAETGRLSTALSPDDIQAAQAAVDRIDKDAVKVGVAQTEVEQGALLGNQIDELTEGLASGTIPRWAQPTVVAVDKLLASRGLSRSTIGEQEYKNTIMKAAITIGSQQAQVVQQTSLANLSNRQQAFIKNSEIKTNFLLSNQAATNAASKFNASSKNQINTFMAQLKTSVNTFNAQQTNAIQQFNANANNSMTKFNAQLQTQTSQFNSAQTNAMAQFNQQVAADLSTFNAKKQSEADRFNSNNAIAVAESNANWRRDLDTQQTQIDNQTNLQNAQNVYALSSQELAQNWQTARDYASWYWQSSENYQARRVQFAINTQNNNARVQIAQQKIDAQSGSLLGPILGIAGGVLGFFYGGGPSGAVAGSQIGSAVGTAIG